MEEYLINEFVYNYNMLFIILCFIWLVKINNNLKKLLNKK